MLDIIAHFNEILKVLQDTLKKLLDYYMKTSKISQSKFSKNVFLWKFLDEINETFEIQVSFLFSTESNINNILQNFFDNIRQNHDISVLLNFSTPFVFFCNYFD